jgi:hypothetical protein
MRIVRSVGAPLLILLALMFACAKPEEATDDLLGRTRAFLDPSTSVLLVASVPELAGTEAYRHVEAELMDVDGMADVVEQLGKPLSEAVQRVVIAMAPAEADEGRPHESSLHVVIETSLDDGFLHRVMTRADNDFESEMVGDTAIWMHHEPDVSVALAQFEDGRLGFGHVDAVRAMTERAASGSGGLSANAETLKAVGDMADGAMAWGVGRIDEAVAAGLPAEAGDVSGLRYGIVAATRDAAGDTIVNARAIAASAGKAQDVEDRIQVFLGLGALADGLDPILSDVLASLSVRRADNVLDLRVVITPEFMSSVLGSGDMPLFRDRH